MSRLTPEPGGQRAHISGTAGRETPQPGGSRPGRTVPHGFQRLPIGEKHRAKAEEFRIRTHGGWESEKEEFVRQGIHWI